MAKADDSLALVGPIAVMLGVTVALGVAEHRKGKPRRNPGRRRRARNRRRCPIDEATSMGTTGGVTMGC